MTPDWPPLAWILLGYVGCLLHIVAASWIGGVLRERRREMEGLQDFEEAGHVLRMEPREHITQPPNSGRGA